MEKARQQADPAPLTEISFKKPKKSDVVPQVSEAPFKEESLNFKLKGFSYTDPAKHSTNFQKSKLEELCKISPNAADFKSIINWSTRKERNESDIGSGNEEESNS